MSIFLFDVLYDNNNNHCSFFYHSRATGICTRRTPFLCPLSGHTFIGLLFVQRFCVCVCVCWAMRVHLINKFYCFFAFCNIINVLRSNKAGGGRLVAHTRVPYIWCTILIRPEARMHICSASRSMNCKRTVSYSSIKSEQKS